MKLLFTLIALLAVACCRDDKPIDEPHFDVDFKAEYLVGSYHGNEHSSTFNYNIVLSDADADSDYYAESATYYYFELYSDISSEGGEYVALPAIEGTAIQYRYDSFSRHHAGRFDAELSYAITTDEAGNPTRINYTAGTLTITRKEGNKVDIVAELTMEDSTTHRIKYSGDARFRNLNNKPYSTLTTDIELSLSDMHLYTEVLGEYISYVDCHYIMLSEDAEAKSGAVVILEVLLPHDAENIYGTYRAYDSKYGDTSNNATETYLPGTIEEEALRGAWYAIMESGKVGATMAPMVNGEITISEGDNGTTTFSFDCHDDKGNKITGSATTLAEEQ